LENQVNRAGPLQQCARRWHGPRQGRPTGPASWATACLAVSLRAEVGACMNSAVSEFPLGFSMNIQINS
jgi:hypothetical protein